MSAAAPDPATARADEAALRQLIQTAAYLLDVERFAAWIELYAAEATYELVAYSPELSQEVVWWQADREALSRTLQQLPKHVNDPAKRLHLVIPVQVELAADSASALSHVVVFRTTLEGASQLYAVGRYEDRFARVAAGWRFTRRRVVLDTRLLEAFTHVPI